MPAAPSRPTPSHSPDYNNGINLTVSAATTDTNGGPSDSHHSQLSVMNQDTVVDANNTMILNKKRERTTNWSYEEKRMLLELCRRDMVIIENKRLDADLTTIKNRAWKLIHREFCKAFGNERNVNRLKEQWRRMKAYTRAEISDYQQRVGICGRQVADQKRPAAFTFEVWDFMQESKRVCRSEAMEALDYGKIRLAMESSLGPDIDDDSIDGDYNGRQFWPNIEITTPSITVIDTATLSETINKSDSNDTGSSEQHPSSSSPLPLDQAKRSFESAFGLQHFMGGMKKELTNQLQLQNGGIGDSGHQQHHHHHLHQNSNNNVATYQAPSVSCDNMPTSGFSSMQNMFGTLEALQFLRGAASNMTAGNGGHFGDEAAVGSSIPTSHLHLQNGVNGQHQNNGNANGMAQYRTSSPAALSPAHHQIQRPSVISSIDVQKIMDMQTQEHNVRMEMLQLQMQTAQFNRDAAEINKMIALRNLSVAASSTMPVVADALKTADDVAHSPAAELATSPTDVVDVTDDL